MVSQAHLKVRGEAIDGPDQIIRNNSIENPPFQEFIVLPVAHNDFVWTCDLEANLRIGFGFPNETCELARALTEVRGLLVQWREKEAGMYRH